MLLLQDPPVPAFSTPTTLMKQALILHPIRTLPPACAPYTERKHLVGLAAPWLQSLGAYAYIVHERLVDPAAGCLCGRKHRCELPRSAAAVHGRCQSPLSLFPTPLLGPRDPTGKTRSTDPQGLEPPSRPRSWPRSSITKLAPNRRLISAKQVTRLLLREPLPPPAPLRWS